MNAIDPKLARYTAAELESMAAMAQDVIDEGGPFAATMAEVLAEYNAALAIMTGSNVQGSSPDQAQDDVRVGRPAGSPTSNQYGTFAVHTATEKQVAFLARLLAEKNTDGVKVPSTLEGISKTAASALIDQIIDRPAKTGAAPVTSQNGASEKQVAFLVKLAGEKEWDDLAGGVDARNIRDALEGRPVDRKTVSGTIDWMLTLQRKAAPVDVSDPSQTVPAGRYAIVGEDGTVDFYQIDKPEQGKWAGYTFVKLLVGSVGDFSEIAVRGAAAKTVAQKILDAKPEEAARLFGQKTKHCGSCLSPLSNPQSRASGYGETCASKRGYWYPTLSEALKILGEG